MKGDVINALLFWCESLVAGKSALQTLDQKEELNRRSQ